MKQKHFKKILTFLLISLPSTAFQTVEINSASKEQIALLPGIGEGIAKKIVDYRTKKGFFREKSELLGVSGLNQKKYEGLVSKISISIKKPDIKNEMLVENIDIPKIIDLNDLEKEVLKHLNLEYESDSNLLKRVKKSGHLPTVSLSLDAGKRDGLSEKKSFASDPSFLTKNVFEYSAQIKASMDFSLWVFNDNELEALKLILRREEERAKIIDKVHKKYFRYKHLIEKFKTPQELLELSSISRELEEIEAELNFLSAQAFTKYKGL